MKSSYIYMIGDIIPKVIGILLLPVLTKYLSPEDYGIIAYVDALIIFIFIFSVLALNSFLLREYFEYKTEDDQKKLLGNVFVFLITYNVISFFFFFFILKLLFEIAGIKIDFYPIMLLALLSNFFEIFSVVPLVIYRVKEKALKFIVFTISKTFFQMGSIVILLVYFEQGVLAKYYGVLGVNFVFAIVSTIIMLNNSIINFNFEQIKVGLKFSFPIIAEILAFVILDISDRFILEKFVSLDELGIYSIAYTLGFGVGVVITGGYRAFEPVLFKEGKKNNFIEIFYSIKSEYLFLVFFVGVGVVLFSQEILKVMVNEAFYSAYLLVPLIATAAVVKGIYMLYTVLLMIKKRTKVLSIAAVIGAVVNIVINVIFIEKYGIIVAAISTLIAFSVMTIFVHYRAFLYFDLQFKREIKDYLPVSILLILGYLLYYYFDVTVSLEAFGLKVLALIASFFILLKFYNIKLSSLLNTKLSNDS